MRHKKEKKQRVDRLLVEQGVFASRQLAQRAIMAGDVRVGTDHVIQSPATMVPEDTVFNLTQRDAYVSRGAQKLIGALDQHLPRLDGKVAVDLGASTGGFTDLMLQRGARRVYAVDVGYGQLHAKLRENERVVVLERVNARHLTAAQLPEPAEVITADLSFISVTKVLPAVAPLVMPRAWAFVLIKPQFEARREDVGKGGVVRDDGKREAIVADVVQRVEHELGWHLVDVAPSPIKGPKGNVESMSVWRLPA